MKVTIIGTGLIGGSLAIACKNLGIATECIGVESNPKHAEKALERGLVNRILPLKEAIHEADMIFIAVPVHIAGDMINTILEETDTQVVVDLGSTKEQITSQADAHPKRGRFVAAHPMWGTEFSGPEAAVAGAFKGNAVVICDEEKSDPDAFEQAQDVFTRLGMKVVHMNATAHDVHAAYVSHISHISSFALANTVLEKEKEESAIFEMASGGFESTVRLAKSSASMWVPIFQQNRENVLDVLNEHISQLRKFKSCLEKENYTYLAELIENANRIRRILK